MPEFLSKHEQKNLSLALKFHVQTILGSTTERRHDRYQYSAQLDICFSLLSAHFYLSKAKTFNETLMLENNYGFQSESKLLLNWDKDTPDTLPQVNSSRLLDREAKQLYQTSVLDVSLNGYRIKWKGETPKIYAQANLYWLRKKPKRNGEVESFAGLSSLLIKARNLDWKFWHKRCIRAQFECRLIFIQLIIILLYLFKSRLSAAGHPYFTRFTNL